jgi:hypothetical protein
LSHHLGRRFVLAAVALLLVGTGVTARADDSSGPSDVVAVSGCMDTPWPNVQVIGGEGSFYNGWCGNLFAGVPDLCLVAYSDSPAVPALPELAEPCNINFNGYYNSVSCGTMAMNGQAALVSASESEVVTFTIVFVAGQGILTATSSGEDGWTDTWVGVVSIVPTNGACPVTQFRYTAAVTATDI